MSQTDIKPLPMLRYYNPPKEGTTKSGDTLSRERIRQIEKVAMRKMRHELIMRGYRLDDLL